MFEKLFDLITKVFTLTTRVDRHDKDIEELERENKRLAEIIEKQSLQIEILAHTFKDEREKTMLWVENQMLKFEKRLPMGKERKDDEKDS